MLQAREESNLESGKFEEILLFRHFQQMVLNEGVHLGQKSSVSHGAGKVTKGDGVLGVHFGKQVVATNLLARCPTLIQF